MIRRHQSSARVPTSPAISIGTIDFRRWVDIAEPRTAAAALLIRKIKSDPRFPRDIESLSRLQLWVRLGPRMPLEARLEASSLWAAYVAWRRARDRAATTAKAA